MIIPGFIYDRMLKIYKTGGEKNECCLLPGIHYVTNLIDIPTRVRLGFTGIKHPVTLSYHPSGFIGTWSRKQESMLFFIMGIPVKSLNGSVMDFYTFGLVK
jgi:hypothetical protein